MGQWDYKAVYAFFDSSEQQWTVSAAGAKWAGWNQILGNLSDQGWEIFSIVLEQRDQLGGGTGYRIFCKKPR